MCPSKLVLSTVLAIGLALPTGAFAQQEPGAPGTSQTIPEKDSTRPQDQPVIQPTPGDNLTERLKQNDGVIRPQGNVDPGINLQAPTTGTTPVIPPAGSPGSTRPNADPK